MNDTLPDPWEPTSQLSEHLQEHAVDPMVSGQLWVERSRQQIPLPNGDRPARCGTSTYAPKHLDVKRVRIDTLNPRGADEDPRNDPFDSGKGDRSFEGVGLSAEGVAPYSDRDTSECLLTFGRVQDVVCQHDHPGT